jgi:uncharacterized protein
MLSADVQDFVRRQRLGFVATVSPDGLPAVSPKGTTTVWDADHLVFADIASPGTVHNLRHNPAVQVNVVDVFHRRGYRLTGAGRVHEGDATYRRGVEFYAEQGLADSGSRIRRIVLIEVTAVDTLWSPAYDLGLSGDEIRDQWWGYWAGQVGR